MEKHEERLPPRGLPVVYFLAGHVALLIAAGGWLLFGGTALAAANTAVVLRHARRS